MWPTMHNNINGIALGSSSRSTGFDRQRERNGSQWQCEEAREQVPEWAEGFPEVGGEAWQQL
jgi:hypothetical protein